LSGSVDKKTVSDNNVLAAVASINEVNIKRELIADDAVASTSREQHMAIEREESIDINNEPLTSQDENCSLNLVSLHISILN
jgi:hypothetical protein